MSSRRDPPYARSNAMDRTTLRFIAPVIPLALFCASACNKDKPTGATGETAASAAPVASAAPAPAASEDLRAPEPGAVCVASGSATSRECS